MTLDHGVLNTPLSKRGNTLFGETRAQFDRRVKADAKAARAAHIRLRAEAVGLIEMVSNERMAELGKRHGMTARKTRKVWHDIATRTPKTVIQAMRKELRLP